MSLKQPFATGNKILHSVTVSCDLELNLRSVGKAFHSDIVAFQWGLWEDVDEIVLNVWTPFSFSGCVKGKEEDVEIEKRHNHDYALFFYAC